MSYTEVVVSQACRQQDHSSCTHFHCDCTCHWFWPKEEPEGREPWDE